MHAGVNKSQKFSIGYIAFEGSSRHLSGILRSLLLNRCVSVWMRNGCPRLMHLNTWSLIAGLFRQDAGLLECRALLKEVHHYGEGLESLISLSVFSLHFLLMAEMCSLSFLFWPLSVMPSHHDGLLSFRDHKTKLFFDILSHNRKVTVMMWN